MKVWFLLFAPLAFAAEGYIESGVIGLPPSAGPIAAVATGLKNQLYVFNRGEAPILVYDAGGSLKKSWGRGLFVTPQALRVDSLGNIWTADSGNHVVRKFGPDGSLLRTFGEVGVPGGGPAHLSDPSDVAVGWSGRVYVADGGNARIIRFLRDGSFSAEFGQRAVNLALDARERIWVSGPEPGKVELLSAEGKRLSETPARDACDWLFPLRAVDKRGILYVAEPEAKIVRKFQKQ